MLQVFAVTLPFFAVIGCGYLAGYWKMIGEAGIRGINAFVFLFALPCLLFRTLAIRDMEDVVQPEFLAAYGLPTLGIYAVAFVGTRLAFGVRAGEAALAAQASTVANLGFMGIPLILAVFGEPAVLPLVLAMTFDLLVTITISVMIIEGSRGNGGGALTIVRHIVKGLIGNAFILSILAGVIWAIIGPPIPEPIDRFLVFLGQAAGPCALFALGASLVGRPISSGYQEVLWISYVKLVLHPLAVWAVFTSFPIKVDPLWVTVAILAAALPVAGNVFVFAQRYGMYVARASTAVLISTVIAVFSFSAVLAWLTG